MRTFRTEARIVLSAERLAELRVDVAMRRKALMVNSIIYGMRFGDSFRAVTAALLRPDAAAALAAILAALARGERWTDTTSRRLTAAMSPIRRESRLSGGDPYDESCVAWHIDRLDEMMAQHETLRNRETILEMASTERLSVRATRGRRRRGVVSPMGRRPAAPKPAA